MRIVHLITRLILGGAQENTVLSAVGQQNRGHHVTLAFGPIFGPEGSLLDQVKAAELPFVELPDLCRQVRPLRDRRAMRQITELIDHLKPDVVHTHSSKAGILGRWAAWRSHVPAVVHTIHGLPFHPYQSRLTHAAYVAAERFAARRCHRLISVADAMTQQALAQCIGEPAQYRTIYSGMDVSRYFPDAQQRAAVRRDLGIRPDQKVIGTVARLAELKGHDDLIDALRTWLHDRPNVKLLWVGDGWWRDRLQQRLAEAGLTKQVLLTGLVPWASVADYMRAMDVLVHPSYREGLARTLPQALLCGTPVIAYDLDGSPEVCIPGQTGCLVPPGDLDALRESVNWMLSHPDQAHAMAQRGRALCLTQFSADRMVDQLLDTYQQVLDR